MTTMYQLNPIINHDKNIDRPKCMYEMKNINGDGDSNQKCKIVSEITGQFVELLKAPLGEVSALEARQEKILEQLAELKQQVLNLCDVLKENNEIGHAGVVVPSSPRVPISESFVLNVNPSRPCYSVLALKAIWKDVDVVITPFVHSNVKSKKIESFTTTSTGQASVIKISLIWKDVVDLEVITGIHGHVIMGETNLLRYLVRKLSGECYGHSTSSLETIRIDRILDLSHRLVYQETPKNKQQILSALHEQLRDNTWFSGEQIPNITDAAVWSALKQSAVTGLPPNLQTWNKRCDDFFHFKV